jgi:hypothetical protein
MRKPYTHHVVGIVLQKQDAIILTGMYALNLYSFLFNCVSRYVVSNSLLIT